MDTNSRSSEEIRLPRRNRTVEGSVRITDLTEEARGSPAFDNHEQVVLATHQASGLRALIAIHDRTLGPALGGCRMWTYATEQDAMTDVLRLSRAMTLKTAVAGLAAGGGKSVIIGDPRIDKSESLFDALGHALNHLEGRFVTGKDVGISTADMARLARVTPHVVGARSGGCGDPSQMTALGVFRGIEASLRHKRGRETLHGITVAVQGLGHVGFALSNLLRGNGARLVVADLDEAVVARAVRELGATPMAPDDIIDAEAEIYAPCALGAVLTDESIPRLRCSIVAGSANNQLLLDRHGEALRKRGILYAPDYVINAGGVISCALELTPEGFTPERARRSVARIADTLTWIYVRADAEGVATNVVADRIALERIALKAR